MQKWGGITSCEGKWFVYVPWRGKMHFAVSRKHGADDMKEPGLDGRHRDKTGSKKGEIQQKRGDTLNKNPRTYQLPYHSLVRALLSPECVRSPAKPVSEK